MEMKGALLVGNEWNIALWIAQVLLRVMFLIAGVLLPTSSRL
jgi:hypothetical protein